MKPSAFFAGLALLSLGAVLPAGERYAATFESLAQANPAPEWFRDAKFGIYLHWGVYSVPAFGSEWYPYHMYREGTPEYRHHLETYGGVTVWPYDRFITGGQDLQGRFVQFAPKLKSEGGSFDPAEWARLFADAGAKFAGPVAEHHDGFSMWASRVNPWNAQDMGPKLDVVGLLADAIRQQGMKVILSMHHAYNITGFYEAAPPTDDPRRQVLYGQQGKEKNEALWLAKHKEIIDAYRPDVIWQDFNLNHISQPVLLEFLAYYYNQATRWDREVVATYKDGLSPRVAVLDYERGGPPYLKEDTWLTDDAISSSSWSYTKGIGYYSLKQVLHGFLDRISKNGNLLLNVSPRADGSIPQEQKDLLLGMGAWLRTHGEAVYGTRAWVRFGEGPTKMGADHGVMGPPLEGTARDIRYTRAKDNSALYAILLGWDDDRREITLESLSSERIDGRKLSSVALIDGAPGVYRALTYTQDERGLHVQLPVRPATELAYVIKLTFDGGIPAYDNFAALDTAPRYHLVPGGSSGDLVVGAGLSLTDRRKDVANQWQLEPGVPGVYVLRNRAEPDQVLACDGDDRSLVLVRFTGDDRQRWHIRHGAENRLSVVNARNPGLVLTLPADAGAGARAGLGASLAAAGGWNLREVCEQEQKPFRPHVIPGVIEAEDYDIGCPGDAYRDQDDVNEGGMYRLDTGVDLGACSTGGYTLGWTRKGEWTAYTATVARAGDYRVVFHVATAVNGAALHLECDGVDLTGVIDVPNTKEYQNWTTVQRVIRLPAGRHVLRVVIDGDTVNLNRMDFEETE